ncbi:MAG: exodeoxyribonuclease V subunit alpha [Chlamydiales bacterium]
MTSPYLEQLLADGYLEEIDLIFAKWLSKKTGREEEEEQIFLAALFWSSRQGHLCFSLDEEILSHFGKEKMKILEYSKKGSQNFPFYPFICQEAGYFYLQKNWMFETQFHFHLKRLIAQGKKAAKLDKIDDLTEEQHRAVMNALSFSLSLISGGPGTGKTHTAAKIVEVFLKQNRDARVLLAAPTGKAARRLSTNNSWGKGVVVSTLHSLLGIHRESPFNLEPSPLMADLLIVDECSMVDARLFSHLLASVKEGTHLVLIGDPHQLPAVENGSLFADLVDLLKNRSSACLTLLTRCLRSDRQEILECMQSVLKGDLVQHGSQLLQITDYTAVDRKYAEIRKIAETNFTQPDQPASDPELLLARFSRFTLLSCLRRGPFGVDALNQMLADHFLDTWKGGMALAMPILITKSSEDRNLFNGETGLLMRHRSRSEDYAIFGPPGSLRKIPAVQLPAYEYAYALSVHKSQGSEYDEVLLLVPPGSEQLGREVIYTGASRAKKHLRIAADQNALTGALLRPSRKISALHLRNF